MKANIEIKLKPLQVPNMVEVDLSGAPKTGAYHDLAEMHIPIYQLDTHSIDKLCEEFRDTMFKNANLQQPPREA